MCNALASTWESKKGNAYKIAQTAHTNKKGAKVGKLKKEKVEENGNLKKEKLKGNESLKRTERHKGK